jgi:hypothetical protein
MTGSQSMTTYALKLALIIVLILAACSTTSTVPTASPAGLESTQIRAMWLWSETPDARSILENREGAQDKLFAFMSAPHGQDSRSINRLYFEARNHSHEQRMSALRTVTFDPVGDPDHRPALRAFLKRAHAQGVQVEYLDGQAIWLASDDNAGAPQTVCRDVVEFNQMTDDPGERFDGVHFDIEPHTVTSGPYGGRWFDDRLPNGYNRRWTARWQQIFEACRLTFDAYAQHTGHHLTLAADLGADFAYYNKPMRDFFDRVDAPTDYVAVMNYFDNRTNRDGEPSFFYGAFDGSNMVGGVEQNLALWRETPVVFGLETGPTRIAADQISFHQEGHLRLYKTIDRLAREYRATNCIGAAIHHYAPDAYRDLKP